MSPFDGLVPYRKTRSVPASEPDKLWMRQAGLAFRDLTGKKAVDDVRAWRVFFEALRAAAFPTRPRRKWLTEVAEPLLEMSQDARRADVLPRVKQALAGPAPGMTLEESEKSLNDRIRWSLAWLDERFGEPRKLTDNAIANALKKPDGQIAAALSLASGAFGDKRRPNESESKALKRIATAYRMAISRVEDERRKKTGLRKKK